MDTLTFIGIFSSLAVASFAYISWRNTLPTIKTGLFPPIVGGRGPNNRSYIFYLYCVNQGSTTTTIRDIRMNLSYKDGRASSLERVRALHGPTTFSTPTGDTIDIDYDHKKFPITENLKQGKPIKGFVIFEEPLENQGPENVEKITVIVEDVFGNFHENTILSEKVIPTLESLSQLSELADIKIPESALR